VASLLHTHADEDHDNLEHHDGLSAHVREIRAARAGARDNRLDLIGGGLPFTNDQFFGVFALYNRTFVVVVVALWLASMTTLAFVSRDPARRSPTLSLFLGALWLWNACAYHVLFFTRINPAAWLFAALFVVQAGLFFWATAGRRVEYFSSTGWRRRVGLGLVAYALAYPFLTIALGHSYPETPTFGVPCPTAILTIGVLVSARGHPPLTLAIVPIVWSFIGGSAAALLEVPTDYVLLGAGIALTAILVAQRVQPGRVLR
jgi:hypothetical protein